MPDNKTGTLTFLYIYCIRFLCVTLPGSRLVLRESTPGKVAVLGGLSMKVKCPECGREFDPDVVGFLMHKGSGADEGNTQDRR